MMVTDLSCQELTRYLQLVRDTWSSIVVGLVPPSAVDAQTVNELQLLHPRLSTCDRVKIREAFETKRAFPGIEDRTTRAELLRRAFACQSLIPSIYTFMEDTKFLEPAAIIMKKLVAGKWEKKEQIESRYRENYSGTEPQYSLRYQSLWLFSIAHFPELIDMAPRKDAGRQKPTVKEVSAARWKCLADTARRLGFDSQSIDAFANIDAHSATIRAFLLRLYPDMEDQVCTTLVAEVNKVIAGQSDHRHRTQDSPIFTTDLIDVGPDRRCGRPFAEDHEVNRPFCDYPFMWQSTDVPARRYIGPFTVLQSIFQAFFGAPNVDSAMGEDSGEEAQPTNVEEDPSTEDDIDPPPDHREDVDGTTSGGDRRDAQPTKVDELPHTEDNIGRPPDHHEGATGAMNGNDRRDAHLTDKSAVLSQDQADSISQSQRDLDEHLQDVDDSLFHPSNDSISWEGSDESQSHPPNGTTNVGGEPFRRLQQPALPQVPQPQRPASLEQILDENPWKLYPRPLPHSADVSPTTETCGKRTWTGTRQTQSRAKRKARRAPQEVLETIEKFVHTVTTQLGNNIAISEDPRQGPLMLHSYNTIQELKSALAARDKDGLKLTYWVIAESGNGNYVSRQDLAPRHKLLFALWQDSGQDRNVNILDRVVRHFKDAPPHKVESKIMKPSAEKLREELVQHYILHYDGSESMNGWEGGSAIWQIAVDEGEY